VFIHMLTTLQENKFMFFIFILLTYYLMKQGVNPEIFANKDVITYLPNPRRFKLKTMTYNVFGRWCNLTGKEGQTERLSAMPRSIYKHALLGPDIDIITLNELWCPDAQFGKIVCGNDRSGDIIIKKMAKYGWKYHTQVLCSLGAPLFKKQTGGGCIIFSKWPIVSVRRHLYKSCSGGDCCASKGIVYARILKKLENGMNQPINVFVTHLQAWPSYKEDLVREQQLEELRYDFMYDIDIPKNRSEIVLFQGDFNTENTDMLENKLDATLPVLIGPQKYSYDAATNILVGKDGMAGYLGCGDVYRKTLKCPCCPGYLLDYIFYSKNPFYMKPTTSTMQVVPLKSTKTLNFEMDMNTNIFLRFFDRKTVKIKTKELSDHYPVVANFIFN